MATTHKTDSNSTWTQAPEYYAKVNGDGHGTFVRVPDMPELATVAEVHGAKAAQTLYDMMLRALNAGFKTDSRDRISLFDKHLAENAEVRAAVRAAAAKAGVTTVSDDAVTAAIVGKYRGALIAKFGDSVAAAGYTPKKKGTRSEGETGELAELDL